MNDTRRLLRAFEAYPQDRARQSLELDALVAGDLAMVDAADHTYTVWCQETGSQADSQFRSRFIRAWSDFTRNALSHMGPACPDAHTVDLGVPVRALYVMWHFPEYPLLLAHFLDRKVVVAAAQDTPWMHTLERAGLVVNFRSFRGMLALRRRMEKGESVVMMLDYCYPGTRHRVIEFLRHPCRTPCGLVELALRWGYELRLVVCNAPTVYALTMPYAASADDALLQLNTYISQLITAHPTRWLMWPSLRNRI